MPLMQAVTDSEGGLLRQMDITAPEGPVEIQIADSPTGQIIWVNLEGVCVLRVCRISAITLDDLRPSPNESLS